MKGLVRPIIVGAIIGQTALPFALYQLSIRQLGGKGKLAPKADRLHPGPKLRLVANAAVDEPRVRRFMHNRCGDLFGPGSLGQDKALVEIAAIQRLPELSKASRNQEHPDPLEIAKEALEAKGIVSLDQVECRLHPLKDKRVLGQKEPADPKAF